MLDFRPLRKLSLTHDFGPVAFRREFVVSPIARKAPTKRPGLDIYAFFARAMAIGNGSVVEGGLPKKSVRTNSTSVGNLKFSGSRSLEIVAPALPDDAASLSLEWTATPISHVTGHTIDSAQFSAGQTSESIVAGREERIHPNQIDELLPLSVRELVEDNGVERIKSFAALKPGWDQGRGKPLKGSSLKLFSGFFGYGTLKPKKLSVFLSLEGNLIGNWLDGDGSVVELEFSERGIAYFIERTAEESIAPYGVAGDFKRSLASTSVLS